MSASSTESLAPVTDQALVDQARQGSHAAFTELVCRHNGYFIRVAHSMGANGTSEDAVQQAWMKIFQKLDQFEGGSSFRTWATSIVRNNVFESYRHVHNDLSLDTDHEPTGNAVESVTVARWAERLPSSDKSLELLPEVVSVRAAIARLSPELQTVIAKVIEGYTVREIADDLKLPFVGAKLLVYNARQEIRQALRKTIWKSTPEQRCKYKGRPSSIRSAESTTSTNGSDFS